VRGGRRKYFLGVSEMVFTPSMAQRFQSRLAPVSTSMSSRSSGHRAQLGGARSAHEAALRKRLPSPLEKRCFSSASQIGQPAFWRVVHAIHGATMVASTGPGLAFLGKAFGPRKALLFVCFADRASPCHFVAEFLRLGTGRLPSVIGFLPGWRRAPSAHRRAPSVQNSKRCVPNMPTLPRHSALGEVAPKINNLQARL